MQNVHLSLLLLAGLGFSAGCAPEGGSPADEGVGAAEETSSMSTDLDTDFEDGTDTDDGADLEPDLDIVSDEEPLAAWGISSHTRFALASMTSGKCLDVPSSSTAEGMHLQQYPCKSGGNQFFYWEPVQSSTQVRIRTLSYKCLDISDGTLRQRSCTNSASQKFTLEPAENPHWRGPHHIKIRLASDTSKCLDVPGFSQDNHELIGAYACNGGPNQRWLMMVNEFAA